MIDLTSHIVAAELALAYTAGIIILMVTLSLAHFKPRSVRS